MADEKLRHAILQMGKALSEATTRYEQILALLDAEGLDLPALTKRALETFGTLWKTKYGESYVFTWAIDRANAKRLLKGMSIEKLEDKMAVYMLVRDRFIEQQRHPFGLFVKQINSLGDAGRATSPKPMGCSHMPACGSDMEHTQRNLEAMRHG